MDVHEMWQNLLTWVNTNGFRIAGIIILALVGMFIGRVVINRIIGVVFVVVLLVIVVIFVAWW